MDKVLIEVKLPAASISYDLFVPENMQIGTLTRLTASAFSKLSHGVYAASGNAVLCEQETGKQYDVDKRIYETNIRNGSKLILY